MHVHMCEIFVDQVCVSLHHKNTHFFLYMGIVIIEVKKVYLPHHLFGEIIEVKEVAASSSLWGNY